LQALEPLDYAGTFQEVRTRRETLRTFFTAENLEKAEHYAGAARGYLMVIGTVGEGLPTKEAIERLKALQKDHPEMAKVRAYPATRLQLHINGEPEARVGFEEVGAVPAGEVKRCGRSLNPADARKWNSRQRA
jgi:hypothetical protein